MDHEWRDDSGARLRAGVPGSTAGLDGGAHPRSESLQQFRGVNFPVYKARLRARLQAAGLLHVLDGGDTSTVVTAAAAAGSGDGDDVVGTLPRSAKKKKKAEDPSSAGAAGTTGQGSQPPRRGGQAEQDQHRVYGMLILTLDDAHVAIVTSEVAEGDAAGAWRVLLRMYERNTTASKHQLRRELHRVKLGPSETVEAYKARVMHVVGRLRAMREHVSDGETIYCLLEGLPKEYEIVRQSLEVQEALNMEQICAHLKDAQEKLTLRYKEESLAAATLSQHLNAVGTEHRAARAGGGDRQAVCGLCRRHGHWIGQCPRRKGKSPGECYACGGRGHSWRDCDESESGSTTGGSTSSSGGHKDSGQKGARWLGAMDMPYQQEEEKYPTGGYLDQADRLRKEAFSTGRR